jgi:hypothetical protein
MEPDTIFCLSCFELNTDRRGFFNKLDLEERLLRRFVCILGMLPRLPHLHHTNIENLIQYVFDTLQAIDHPYELVQQLLDAMEQLGTRVAEVIGNNTDVPQAVQHMKTDGVFVPEAQLTAETQGNVTAPAALAPAIELVVLVLMQMQQTKVDAGI